MHNRYKPVLYTGKHGALFAVMHLLCMARNQKVTPHPKPSIPRTFVREWRKHRGYSLETLAEMVGMSHASLSRIERGIQNYDAEFLAKASDALRCGAADLLIRDPSDPDGIWSIWDAAKPGERSQIVELSRVVVNRRNNAA